MRSDAAEPGTDALAGMENQGAYIRCVRGKPLEGRGDIVMSIR
jgi:hypothetical protein